MAQPHSQTQQRPAFPPQTQSYTHGYPPQPPPNARPQFSPQSPQHSLSYSSPSPQAPPPTQYSPTFSNQAPPAKRPRLSEEPSASYPPPVATPRAASPVSGQINGLLPPGQARSNLMPPPQQPPIKKEEVDGANGMFRDNTPSFGHSISQLPSPMPNSLPHPPTAPGHTNYSPIEQIPRPNVNGMNGQVALPPVNPEELLVRKHERYNWEEARHASHELWDPFLYGGTLNDRIKGIAHRSNLVEPQAGVLVNTQKNQPPPVVRVNGLEGATRIIRDGQSIIDTREKADRLSELVKLISLSAKARLTGLLQTGARIANERRQHASGRIPDDWTDIAVKSKAPEDESISSPAPSAGTKRTHDQANGDDDSQKAEKGSTHAAAAAFAKFSSLEMKAEQARQAKRRKRNEVITAQENEATAAAEQEALNAATAEDSKKTTKKERRIAESRLSEQQQHQSTNEAARMATSNLFGKFPGSKKKNYSWLQPGSGGTPARSASSTAVPTRATSVAPTKEKSDNKGPQLGQFDEASDPGIQARDMLLVLESDGRAAKSYVRGSSAIDDSKDSA